MTCLEVRCQQSISGVAHFLVTSTTPPGKGVGCRSSRPVSWDGISKSCATQILAVASTRQKPWLCQHRINNVAGKRLAAPGSGEGKWSCTCRHLTFIVRHRRKCFVRGKCEAAEPTISTTTATELLLRKKRPQTSANIRKQCWTASPYPPRPQPRSLASLQAWCFLSHMLAHHGLPPAGCCACGRELPGC